MPLLPPERRTSLLSALSGPPVLNLLNPSKYSCQTSLVIINSLHCLATQWTRSNTLAYTYMECRSTFNFILYAVKWTCKMLPNPMTGLWKFSLMMQSLVRVKVTVKAGLWCWCFYPGMFSLTHTHIHTCPTLKVCCYGYDINSKTKQWQKFTPFTSAEQGP